MEPRKPASRKKRVLRTIGLTLTAILFIGFLAFKLSPWPSALLIRSAFNKEAIKTNKALEKHVPAGVVAVTDVVYDPGDKNALMDIYYPSSVEQHEKLPVIVWTHGGGWISGNRKQVGNYCKILASKGYAVVSLEFTIAPEAHYPVPLQQTNRALRILQQHAATYPIDTNRFIFAGDSGGAHMAAQMANIIADSAYAKLVGIIPALNRKQVVGLLLCCGPYDARNLNLDGDFGGFLKTVLWSYSGTSDFETDERFKTASILHYITNTFPPCFITAGNGDPLETHSRALAGKLRAMAVYTDTLFFPANYMPAQPHEYQFNLDTKEGKLALDKTTAFLEKVTGP